MQLRKFHICSKSPLIPAHSASREGNFDKFSHLCQNIIIIIIYDLSLFTFNALQITPQVFFNTWLNVDLPIRKLNERKTYTKHSRTHLLLLPIVSQFFYILVKFPVAKYLKFKTNLSAGEIVALVMLQYPLWESDVLTNS